MERLGDVGKGGKGCLFLSLHLSIYLKRHIDTLTAWGGGGGGVLHGGEGKVPGINNRSPQSLDKSKARRSRLLILRRMRPPRMLFGVRASRVGSYVQQAQTAKRFAKDKVSRGFLHPSSRLPPQHPQDPRAIGSAIPRHAGSPPPPSPSPPSPTPKTRDPARARRRWELGGEGGVPTASPPHPGGSGAAGAWRSAACPRPRSARRLRRWAPALRKEKTLPPER